METMLMLILPRQSHESSLSKVLGRNQSIQAPSLAPAISVLFASIVASLLSSACAVEPPALESTQVRERILHPSPDDLIRGDVLPGSYLVAFRGQPGGPSARTLSFMQEALQHTQSVDSFFRSDSRVKETRFLTALPFPMEQADLARAP